MRFQNFPRTCLRGDRYGRWTVLNEAEPYPSQRAVVCRCSCGTERRVPISGLRSGRSRSCGCLRREVSAELCRQGATHGMSGTAEHNIWKGIHDRCRRPSNKSFRNYGGRGIRVCERWGSFENFLADMGARPSAKHSVDRIDHEGDYEPRNCRWATPKQQARNSRRNRMLRIDGVERLLCEWSEVSGVPSALIWVRIDRLGWEEKRAVFTPSMGRQEACRRAQRLRWGLRKVPAPEQRSLFGAGA